MAPKIIHFSTEEIHLLRRRFENLAEVTPFAADPKLAAKVAGYGLFREIGTPNDELARFIFDTQTDQPVRVSSLKAEFIEWNGLFGLRVFSTQSSRLELRTKGFYEVVHPQLSRNEDGTLHSLVIFPEIVNRIAEAQGVQLVLVKSWGRNSIFGGFDPAKAYYQTNFWEIENNDTLLFSDLTRQGRIAFMGTHDLVAHIAGLDQNHWPLLRETAQRVHEAIAAYFRSVTKPSIASLILPYTIGVVLDDLAQPPSYSSENHLAVLNELLKRLVQHDVPANLNVLLTKFPKTFQNVIELSRTSGRNLKHAEVTTEVQKLVREIRGSAQRVS